MVLGTSERKEIIKIRFEDVEIWPDWCMREDKDCRQCHFQGKIACHPRFRQGLRLGFKSIGTYIDELLKQGKTPLEVQNITKAKIGTIYSRGQRLRQKGEIVRLRPPHPDGIKQKIVRLVREHPEKEYKEIAGLLNIEPSYISRLCNKVGIHRRKMLDEKKEGQTKKAIEILKHNPQRSVASIADELGLASTTLINRLKKKGVLPIDHATRIVLDAIREEVIRAVNDALSNFFSKR